MQIKIFYVISVHSNKYLATIKPGRSVEHNIALKNASTELLAVDKKEGVIIGTSLLPSPTPHLSVPQRPSPSPYPNSIPKMSSPSPSIISLRNLILFFICVQFLLLLSLSSKSIPFDAIQGASGPTLSRSLSTLLFLPQIATFRTSLMLYITNILLTRPLTPSTLNPYNIYKYSHKRSNDWSSNSFYNSFVESNLGYGPIDVVYTWVNGSDPIWLESKRIAKGEKEEEIPTPIVNTTTNTTTSPPDDSSSSNRYRDSNELLYSLRSIQKHAPFTRTIYIVTDHQIPKWLNLANPNIRVIPHSLIYGNLTDLPVFSSPSIESHLHSIPNLSQYFLYFNDDVFLGSKTYPSDFVSPSSTQKFYTSWDVPKCNAGCSDTWIGDGYCDKACNVSSCNFDWPDCRNATSGGKGRNKGGKKKKSQKR